MKLTGNERRMGAYKNKGVPGSKVMVPARKPGDSFTDSKGQMYVVAANGAFVKIK
jgi:hypothetical protein